MNTSRLELTSEQTLIGIKLLSEEIVVLSDAVKIKNEQHKLDNLVNHFWQVVKNSSVVHTSIPSDEHNEREVTFVCRGATNSNEEIKLSGDFLKPRDMPILNKIPGTDIYAFSKKLSNNLRTEFVLLKKDDKFEDKWEKDRFVLSMPKARPQPYVPDRNLAEFEIEQMKKEGRLIELTVDEDGFYKGRKYWVHLPKNYNPDPKQKPPYNLLLCFDGQEFQTHIPTPSIMDRMNESKEIKPTLTILLANKGTEERFDEYNCDPDFTNFLANRFIPKIQEQYNVSTDPKDVTLAGSSMGGIGAIYAGLTHPEKFGNVISLSGSLWKDDVVTPSEKHKTTTHERLQTAIDNFPQKNHELRIEMKVGTSENEDWVRPNGTNKIGKEGKCRSMLKVNHDFAEIMSKSGIKTDCKEYTGGHNDACWRGLLSEGLTHKPLQEEISQKSKNENPATNTSGEVMNINIGIPAAGEDNPPSDLQQISPKK